MKKILPFIPALTLAQGQLLVDFNSTSQDGGPHNESGYNAFDAPHEGATPPSGQTYTAFGTSVTVTPTWPNSTARTVRQFIDRGAGNDSNWGSTNIDLLTDWIGVDTRSGTGNGTYDGNSGTPTYLAISLGGLPAGTYDWRSFHHDTENIHTDFQVEYSVDGGGTYSAVNGPNPGGTFPGTDSSPGGNPASAQTYDDSTPKNDLPSTAAFSFTANAGQDVVIRFAAHSIGTVHKDFFILNGFEVESTSPASGPTDLALSANSVPLTAPVGTTVGQLTTTDPTPGDTFTYSLVTGTGDDNNADFEISGGNSLITQRSLSAYPGGSTLSVRVRTTDALGASFEKAIPIQLVNDSDGDGLDDSWEILYFENLTSATGTGNNDGDSLDNLGEQAAGTDPTDPDSDDDGLQDHVETNTGTYVSASNTGSNPLEADSDGDGLSDGVEVSADNGAITDPNNQDSDGDGFNDRVEIENATDPNDANDTPDGLLPLQINEILVSNETGIDDGNGSKQDWLEIFNPNPGAVNLDTFFLTDDPADLTKWNFPAVSIPANGYLLVFASGNDMTDPDGNPHTNFRLTANGEFLAIVRPNGELIDDQFTPTYPEQFSDISYGRPPGGESFVFFSNPTPGSANVGAGAPGVVKDTNFSVDRGFYDSAFDLEIASDTPGALIRYTRDGSLPTLTNGSTYTAPINISTTTNVRAIAYLNGENYIPTNVDTHSYIFVDDVAAQSKAGLIAKGWAENWGYDSQVGQVIPADYDMDPRVVNDTLNLRSPGYSIRDSLLDIPSVSLTMKQEDFVTTRVGTSTSPKSLYGTPRDRFERVCSIEYILPDGSRGFQEDCKIETHGNSSRTPRRMQKHSLRLTFSGSVGIGKLRYNLFPESPVDEFNKLVLRACFTDSWALASWSSARYRPNDSLYTRDVWMKELLRDMGQPSSYGNFVHLYVNGAYFGLHNLTERIEDDFYADHQGGNKEDWEVNADLGTPGPLWNSMISSLSGVSNPAQYEIAKTKIDVENYADWVILHLFGDSEDWPTKNSYAAANALSGDGRYRFNVWDQEIAFDKYSWNRYNDSRTGMLPFQRLRQSDDFKMLFADRVYKHLHDDGALTVENTVLSFLEINDQIDKAIVAESARWGDVQATTPYGNTASSSNNIDSDHYPPTINSPIYFTREQHWVKERDNVVSNYLPTLHDLDDSRSFIRELRGQNLYPSIDPPAYSQFGGVVPMNFPLQLSSPDGAVYYTTDGSDPRLDGGSINPAAGTFGGFIESDLIGINDFGWTYLAGTTALSPSNVVVGNPSYNSGDWKHPSYDDSAWAPDLAGNPNGAQGPLVGRLTNAVSGITSPNTIFDIGPFGAGYPTVYFRKEVQITDADEVAELIFNIIRDDAMIVYVNGREVYRDGFPNAIVNYADFGPVTPSEIEPEIFTYTTAPGDLLEGKNIIAVELHNSSAGNSDLGIQMSVSQRRAAPGGNTVNLTQTGTVRSRTLANGEWSALREADFIVGTPATTGNLVVSEIMYNPQGPDEDLEFIEILNINPTLTLDLTNVSFTDGILYSFPPGFTLPPLQRVVIAKNRDAFISVYGETGFALAPGNFESSLSNGGETLILTANDGEIIQSFDYNDDAGLGWPPSADGLGASLVLIDPLSNPDHNLPTSWKASEVPGGSPGIPDTPYPSNPDDDDDNDGLTNLAEFFFGTNPGVANGNPVSIGASESGLNLTFDRNAFPGNLSWEVQSSDDLQTWSPANLTAEPVTITGGSTVRESHAITPDQIRKFYRVRVTPGL